MQLVKDLMNHQPHTAAEAADLITDWFTDDNLSDEEENQHKNENPPSIVNTARQRQDSLAAARTATKVANPGIGIPMFPILLLDQMLIVLQYI